MKRIQHGIFLKKIDYSESSVIIHLFTLENGFQAFLFQGGKKKKANLLQPLSIVEITTYSRPDSDLGKISEVATDFVPQSIPFHPLKSGLAFFITEMLGQVLKSSDEDRKMYAFLKHEIQWIDASSELTNYPLFFLLKFANQIGVGIHLAQKEGRIFDLQEGEISNQTPTNHTYTNDEVVPILSALLQSDRNEILAKKIHKTHRRQIINHLMDYYTLHIDGFKVPKSLEVIQTIFD
jgi:DNA repair protein RecO (recombination protein O)